MERRVIFRDGMDNDPADYENLQDFAQGSLDHIVADGITPERKYAGFKAVASGVTNLTVQPGRFYSGGKVYSRDTVFEKDFTSSLPVATKKIVSLVVFASEVDTDTRPREILINEETGASEPQVVAMERARVANVNTVAGEANADPLPPIVDAGVIVIATILLTPQGIASVTMNPENALDSVQSLADRAADLERFQTKAGPQIASIAADIASLTNGQVGTVDKAIPPPISSSIPRHPISPLPALRFASRKASGSPTKHRASPSCRSSIRSTPGRRSSITSCSRPIPAQSEWGWRRARARSRSRNTPTPPTSSCRRR
jgi:hypothetical protein